MMVFLRLRWLNSVCLFLVGTVGMAIPFTLVLGSLRRIDATRVGIASMMELVAAGVIAYFWLGQLLDPFQLVGCLLVVAGITILQFDTLPVNDGKIVTQQVK